VFSATTLVLSWANKGAALADTKIPNAVPVKIRVKLDLI
jgi:hypothetical protein